MNHQSTILHTIKASQEVKLLSRGDLLQLCTELRQRIIEVMSTNPGHFGASMGVVELTVAMHYVLDLPDDVLIWDVGHQCYAHKILTQRDEGFQTIRQFGSISGFPKPSESLYDAFGTGHSSTSISAALGIATSRHLQGVHRPTIAVIGDGALTGGMAFEALNHLGTTQANVIVVINDNDMSIDKNVGSLQHHLQQLPRDPSIFELLNIKYTGVVDGHDLVALIDVLEELVSNKGPQVLHIKTQKGKGFEPAEKGDATIWHAPGKFDVDSGERIKDNSNLPKSYQQIVGETLVKVGQSHPNVVVVTPAMSSGSGLTQFAQLFPNRFFDVGIAEQHAVTFSAGLAVGGLVPICVIYSTFLQRAYDQLIHDVALQNLKVLFLIDRAGLVGNDGATHHGLFDLAFLSSIPNMDILVPSDEMQLSQMITHSVQKIEGPIAIRYPRGKGVVVDNLYEEMRANTCIRKGREVAVICIGTWIHTIKKAFELVQEDWSIYTMQWVKPLPDEMLHDVFSTHKIIITIEDGVVLGGIGSAITQWKTANSYTQLVYNWGLPDYFIEHGSVEELYQEVGLDTIGIANRLNDIKHVLANCPD
jgi:1-deoxy-D-xylulose-5-phosphate synthase